jgi:hypothetical protein
MIEPQNPAETRLQSDHSMNNGDIIATSITVLAVLGWTSAFNLRISQLKKAILSDLASNVAGLDTHFARLEARLNARFSSVDRRMDEFLRVIEERNS